MEKMDILLVLDLAGATARFITSARNILSLNLQQIQSPEATYPLLLDIESIAQQISATYGSIRLANSSNTCAGRRKPHDEVLTKICEACFSIQKDLQEAILGLQGNGGNEEHEPLCATRKFVWTSGGHHELVEHEKRLSALELQMDQKFACYIRSNKESIEKCVQELAETSRRLNINRSIELRRLVTDTGNAFRNLLISSAVPDNGEGSAGRRQMPHSSTIGTETQFRDIVIAFSDIAKHARIYATECQLIQTLTTKGRKVYWRETEKYSSPTPAPPVNHSIGFLPLDDFNEWLESGRGIFWISRKTGSDKSTLIGQLFAAPDTRDLLQRWAGKARLNSTFYSAQGFDTTTQGSFDGLLFSIIEDVTRQCPSLLPALFPATWGCLVENQGGNLANVTLRREDLVPAIESLGQVKEFNVKFCFFIDGLELLEEADESDTALLKSLCNSASIKICMTTGHQNTIHRIQPTQTISLPEVAPIDIRHYIKKKLDTISWAAQKKDSDTHWQAEVFEHLHQKSAGSFTWIDLAFSRAINGTKHSEDICGLLERLKQLPTDLQELLSQMLNDVPKDLHDHQARILLLASQAKEPLNVIAFSFLNGGGPGGVLSKAAVPMEQQEIDRRCRNTKAELSELCGFLLDIVPSKGNEFTERVIFSHASVRTYLQSAEAQKLLTKRLTIPFDPHREICNILLCQIKFHKIGPFWEEGGPIHNLVFQFLHEAKTCETATANILGAHINDLEATIHRRKGQTFWWWQSRSVQKGESTSTFIELMIQYKLVGYLKWRFENFPRLIPGPLEMANLLESALIPAALVERSSEMVKVFLDHGADPNFLSDHGFQLDGRPTPWRLFLLHLVKSVAEPDLRPLRSDHDLFLAIEHLLNAGADLEAVVCPSFGSGSSNLGSRLSVDEVIRLTNPQEDASYLNKLIERRRKENMANAGWFKWK